MDLNIVTIDPVTRIVSFKLNTVPRKTVGIEGLIQLVAKTILTTPGTDIWSPEYGGGLYSYQANGINSSKMNLVTSDILSIVKRSEDQIRKKQSSLILNDDEKLKSLQVLSVTFDQGTLAIVAHILVTAYSGLTADMRLPNQLGRYSSEDEVILPNPVSIYNSKP